MTEQHSADEPVAFREWFFSASHRAKYTTDHPAYLAAQEAWEAAITLHPQPAAPAMFGGGLVAIKTLLSRDPCAHAKVAIEMIDAMLAAPAQDERKLTP